MMSETNANAVTDVFFSVFYEELKQIALSLMARERPEHTLTATALVNEAYLRVAPDAEANSIWDSRTHFVAAAAEAMRRVLIDQARAKGAAKRQPNRHRVPLEVVTLAVDDGLDWVLDLDERITQLSQHDATAATMVKLRVYAGLSVLDAGRSVGLTRSCSYDTWKFASTWFAAWESQLEQPRM